MLSASVRAAGRGAWTGAGDVRTRLQPCAWQRSRAAATAIHAVSGDAAAAGCSAEEWASAKPFLSMPGPEPYPLVGNAVRFLPGIGEYGYFDRMKSHSILRERYGDIIRISNVHWRHDVVLVYDPVVVEKMYRNEGVWPIRQTLRTVEYYRSVLRKDWFDGVHGAASSQGKEWYDFRTTVNKYLMQSRSAHQYVGAANEVTDDFISRMRYLRDDKKELPADFINELYKWALESVVVMTLDTRLGCLSRNLAQDSEAQQMIDAVNSICKEIYKLEIHRLWRFISTPPWRRLVKSFDYMCQISEKYVNQAISRSKEGMDGEPSILLRLSAVNPKVAMVTALEMMVAGVDTSSHMTGSVLFHLAKNPQVQQKAREEVLKALPDLQSPVTSDTLNQLPYLKACFKESLRIFPILRGTNREAPADLVLGGYQIPKGVDVMFRNMVMSRDEKHYPRPLSFEPERWLRGDPNAHTASPFVTLPFGFGPRSCVGRRFAEMQSLTLMSKILRNFLVEFHQSDTLEYSAGAINYITSPLKFRLIDQQ